VTKRRRRVAVNADVLARRAAPYAAAHEASVVRAADRRASEPRDLRELVRAVRRAYGDEVPLAIHEGPDRIDAGGTPAMTGSFLAYVDGAANAVDERTPRHDAAGELLDRPLVVGHYVTPFRAALAGMASPDDEGGRRRAAIVAHVTIGDQGPVDAALAEGVPLWCAREVAERALWIFWRRLTPLRLDLPPRERVA
jgi:hypothetical protein